MSAIAISLLASLAVPPSLSDLDQEDGPSTDGGSYELHLGNGVDSITVTDWGDFDDDGQEDFVYLVGDRVEVMLAPGLYEARMNALHPGSIRDFAVLREDGGDVLVVLHQSGVSLVHYDGTMASGNHWDGEPVPGTSSFGTCTHLDARAGSNGERWIAAIDGDLVRAVSYEGGQWSIPSSLPTASGETMTDVVVLRTDPGAPPVIATMTATTVEQHHPFGAGTPSLLPNPIAVHDDIERIERGAAGDWLGLLGHYGTGLPFLATLSGSTITNVQLLPGAQTSYALEAGRLDDDELDDLMLANRGRWQLHYMLDGAASALEGPVFQYDPSQVVDIASEPGDVSVQTAEVTIADVDHDRGGDVLWPLHMKGTLYVSRGGWSSTDHGVELVPVFGDHDAGCYADLDARTLTVLVDLPPDKGEALEVVAWKRELSEGGELEESMDPLFVFSQQVPMPPDTPGVTTAPFQLVIDLPASVIDGKWTTTLYLVVQMLDADGDSYHCYEGRAYVLVPDGTPYTPPHGPTVSFRVVEGSPGSEGAGILELFSQGPGSDVGGGNDANCLPTGTNNPPTRR